MLSRNYFTVASGLDSKQTNIEIADRFNYNKTPYLEFGNTSVVAGKYDTESLLIGLYSSTGSIGNKAKNLESNNETNHS